jgi:hypothetical protein
LKIIAHHEKTVFEGYYGGGYAAALLKELNESTGS